jgi:hypothetical protein
VERVLGSQPNGDLEVPNRGSGSPSGVGGQQSPVDGAIELANIVISLDGPRPTAWTRLKADGEVWCPHHGPATRAGGRQRDRSGDADQVWTSCADEPALVANVQVKHLFGWELGCSVKPSA